MPVGRGGTGTAVAWRGEGRRAAGGDGGDADGDCS